MFLSSAEFFQMNFFEKFFQEYHQSVKQFGSRSGPTFCLSGLICVQTVCEGDQQMTSVGKESMSYDNEIANLTFILN